jgi:hypothetical protein
MVAAYRKGHRSMERRTVKLAEQILADASKSDVEDLIRLLTHYNRVFQEHQRSLAISVADADEFERSVKRLAIEPDGLALSRSQDVYVMSKKGICRLCGK